MNDKLCHLQERVGQVEVCPEERCAFWEHGGAVLPGGCAIERLGLTHEVERDRELAQWLLDLREQLSRAQTHDERRHAHSLFRQLLPPGLRD